MSTDAPTHSKTGIRPGRVLLRAVSVTAWALAGLVIAAGVLALAFRHLVLPNIGAYRTDVESTLSRALGLRVTMTAIEAEWQGLRPQLSLVGVQIHDREGRPALAFELIEADLSLRSISRGRLDLRRLEILQPRLSVRRDAGGEIFVAGLPVGSDEAGGGLSDWLLAQPSIVVRGAQVEWVDELRQAPPLMLSNVTLRFENRDGAHRVGLSGDPPRALAAKLDIRAELQGARPQSWREATGRAYLELDYADLAVWRQWVDYPVDLPRGAGGVRLWADFSRGHIDNLTADVALRDLELRLREDLPVLALEELSGRLHAKTSESRVTVGASRLALVARDGIRVGPTDFNFDWLIATESGAPRAEFVATELDLSALSRLAAHLPLGAPIRGRLAAHAPRGRLSELHASWQGQDRLERYSVRARFEGLGLSPNDLMPGFDGFAGRVDATQAGGTLALTGRQARLDLPRVFPESRIHLDRAAAQIAWTVAEGATDVELKSVSFSNADASGKAFGRYRSLPDGPGEIDLNAQLERARATAVWRYMPFDAGERVREWLRGALLEGQASGARLRLKGDLKKFPYSTPEQGTFLVTGQFSGGRLRYGADWPEVREIAGDLRFEGTRMLIKASSARILGTQAGPVSAEIPDLNAWAPELFIAGEARGPTPQFLGFIDVSPVAGYIGRFTESVKATGEGALTLRLALPLGNLAGTRVEGEFRFADNVVDPHPGVPRLEAAGGRVLFTESGVSIRDGTARLLGSPISLGAASLPEGGLQLNVGGSMTVTGLRNYLDWPLLDHLTGITRWRGTFTVRRRNVTWSVESALEGISSSLPDPLNKVATRSLPLRVARTMETPAGAPSGTAQSPRERFEAVLGDLLHVVLVRREDGGRSMVERGAIGLRERAELPARGVSVSGNFEALNLDHWRRTLRGAAGGVPQEAPFDSIRLSARELTAFGQTFRAFDGRARMENGVWQAHVDSRELSGELSWRSQAQGRLRARLARLSLAEVKPTPPPIDQPREGESEPVRELPGLDIEAETFSLRGKDLGKLVLVAENIGRVWRIEKLNLANEDGKLVGTGTWIAADVSANTQLAFKLDVADSGSMLARLGYPDTLRKGTARFEGKVSWSGAPTSIDYPSFNGTMSIEAQKGQFAKLEPGVGRLLGILSLQALPRRITLDFNDVFSEGFAFDSISGSIVAKAGILETDGLLIQGPAAKVKMSGLVGLADETQNLRVRVQPSIGESVALGAALVNPLAGVATLLAQKVLRDPIEQIFAYEYAITGGWSEPKVEKLGGVASDAGQGR